MNMHAQYEIARNEFLRALLHPIVVIAGIIALVMAYLNGAGDSGNLTSYNVNVPQDVFILQLTQTYAVTFMISTIMAAFLGAISISRERWSSTLSVLLTKPLNRKDYVLGKFFGLAAFLLVFITFVLLFNSLMITIFYRGPISAEEYVWRITVYILALTLCSSLVLALNMLIGIVSKNLLVVTSISMTYIFVEWFWNLTHLLGNLSVYTPINICNKLISPTLTMSVAVLFDTTKPFYIWFYAAVPYILILIAEMFVILTVSIFLFSRTDNI